MGGGGGREGGGALSLPPLLFLTHLLLSNERTGWRQRKEEGRLVREDDR